MKFTDIEFQTNQKIYNINRAICKFNAYLKTYALTHPGEKGCRKLTISEEIKIHDFFVNSDGTLNEKYLQGVESYEDLVQSVYNVWQKNINEYHVPNQENRKRVMMPTVNFEKIQDNYYVVIKDSNGEALNKSDDLDFDVSELSEITSNGKVFTNLYASSKDGKYEFVSDDSHRSLKLNNTQLIDSSPYYLIQNIDIFGKDSYGNYWCDYDGFDQENNIINVGYNLDETAKFTHLKSNVNLMLFLRHTGAYNLKTCMHDEYMWNTYCRYVSDNIRNGAYSVSPFRDYESISDSDYVSDLFDRMREYIPTGTNSISLNHLANVDDFVLDNADYDVDYVEDMDAFAEHIRHCNEVSLAAFEEFRNANVDLLTTFEPGTGEIVLKYYRANGKPSHSKFTLNSVLNPFENTSKYLVAKSEVRPILETRNSLRSRSTSVKVYPDKNVAKQFVRAYMGEQVRLLNASDDKSFASSYMDANNKRVEYVGTDRITRINADSNIKSVYGMTVNKIGTQRRVNIDDNGVPTVSVKMLKSDLDTDGFDTGSRMFVGAYTNDNSSKDDDTTYVYFQATQRSLDDVRHRRNAYIYKSDNYGTNFEQYPNEARFLYSYNRLKRSINYTKDLLFCRAFDIFADIDYEVKGIEKTSFNQINIKDKVYKSNEDIINTDFEDVTDEPMILKMHQMLKDLYTIGGFDKLGSDDKFDPQLYIQSIYQNAESKPNSFYKDIVSAVDLYNDLYRKDANKNSLYSDLVGDDDEFSLESFIVDLSQTSDSIERIQKLEKFYNDILTPYYVGYIPDNMITRIYADVEQTDADGNILYDENGEILYVQDVDSKGNLKFKEDGSPKYKTEARYTFDIDTMYDYEDENGQISTVFDLTVNSAVLNNYANGAVNHQVRKLMQPYGNVEVLVDDIQILRIAGTASAVDDEFLEAPDALPYNDINIKSIYVVTDSKEIDSGSIVDNKIDFSKFNEKIVIFNEVNAKPMIGDDDPFIDEMGKYIQNVLAAKGRAVEDANLLIDEHGIVRYKYDTAVQHKGKYDNLSTKENSEDFTYGYIGQIFTPNADGTVCTNYNAVSTVGGEDDINKVVVLNPGYSASVEMGEGAVEPRMILKGYKHLLKDQIRYILNENCMVVENRGQLNNTTLNGVYRHLYSSRTPMEYDLYNKLCVVVEDAALRSKDAEIAGLGYTDIRQFYDDLKRGKIEYETFVNSIDESKIAKVDYKLSNGDEVKDHPEFNKETIVTKAFLIQFLQSFYRLPNLVREEAGLFAITGDNDSDVVYDRYDNYYSKMHGINPALYAERDSSYLDPIISNTAYVQGLNGVLPSGATVDDNSHIVPSDKDFDSSIIFKLPNFKNALFDGPDRTNMSVQNIIADGMILSSTGFAQITCGGLTMDDGYVISKDLADANPVIAHDPETGDILRDENGNPILRPIMIGDKIDAHGNKGTIAAIIDRLADIDTIEDADLKWLTLIMRYNKNINIIGAPYPEVSRLTTATVREAFQDFENTENKDKFNALVFDIEKINDSDFMPKLNDKFNQVVDTKGNIGSNADDVDDIKVIDGLVSYMSFILTDKNADVKTHIYSELHEGSKGRTASGQLSFALKSMKCDNLLKAFYASNGSGYDKVNAFLELYGMTINDEGILTNDIASKVKSDSKILSMMPTNEALMESYGFVKQGLDHTEVKVNANVDVKVQNQLIDYVNNTVEEFYNSHSNVTNFNEEFLRYLQTNKKDVEGKRRLYEYCTKGVVSINPVLKNTGLDTYAFSIFKSNMNQAVDEFYQSANGKNVRYYDFEAKFMAYLRTKSKDSMYKNLVDRYTACKNAMDIELLNLKNHFGDYDYMEIPFDYEFKSGAHLAQGEDGGYLYPILKKKYRSNVKDSDGNYIPDQFTNSYYDLIRGAMSYKFWSMLDIDTGVMPLSKQPYVKNTYASLSVHENHMQRVFSKIESEAEAKFGGKRNLMKTAMFGNQIKNAGTMVITAKPSLKLNEIAMSFNNAKLLGIVPHMRDLVDRLGSDGVQSIIDNILNAKTKESFQNKFDDYIEMTINKNSKKSRELRRKRQSFVLNENEFKALPEKERMCMFWRDPLLQPCGVGGFSVVIDNRLKAVAINPVIDKRFDADFDGDTGAVIGFFNKKKASERQLYYDAYSDVQNKIAINHTLINESLTSYEAFREYFNDFSDDTPTSEIYEKLSAMGVLDDCYFNINTDLDIAVGLDYVKESKPELYVEIQKKFDFAKIDALRSYFTTDIDKSQEFAESANDVLSDNVKILLKESVGKFYMRNNTPQNHIDDLVREAIRGYKGNFAKLKDVIKFAAYEFESDNPADNTDYQFIKDYIDASKNYMKDNSEENLKSLNTAKTHYKEVLKTATINPYDFVKDMMEHPDDPKAQNRFNEMLKHFISISFATNIKTMGTGVAGKYLQRGIMLARKFGPEAMAATMRVTYGATQGILQAKHDPEEAVNKFNMIRYFLPALYRGQHLEWEVVDGAEVWRVDENNHEPLTRKEFIDSYVKVCESATGLKFDCHRYNIEILADCIYESKDDDAVPQKNIYDAFKSDKYGTQIATEEYNTRIQNQIDNFSALDMAMYVEKPDKLFECLGMSVLGGDMDWLKPIDKTFEKSDAEYADVCGLVAYNNQVFSDKELTELNTGKPIIRRFENSDRSSMNRNMRVLQKISADDIEIIKDDDTVVFSRKDTNGNVSKFMGKPVVTDKKTGDVLITWDDDTVSNELNKVSQKLRNENAEYRSSYDAVFSNAVIAAENKFDGKLVCDVKLKEGLKIDDKTRDALSKSVTVIVSEFYKENPNVQDFESEFTQYLSNSNGKNAENNQRVLSYMEKGIVDIKTSYTNDQKLADNVNFGVRFCSNKDKNTVQIPEVYFTIRDTDGVKRRCFETTVKKSAVRKYAERNDYIMNENHSHTYRHDELVNMFRNVRFDQMSDALSVKLQTGSTHVTNVKGNVENVESHKFIKDERFGILPEFIHDMYIKQFDTFESMCSSGQYDVVNTKEKTKDNSQKSMQRVLASNTKSRKIKGATNALNVCENIAEMNNAVTETDTINEGSPFKED